MMYTKSIMFKDLDSDFLTVEFSSKSYIKLPLLSNSVSFHMIGFINPPKIIIL